MGVQAALDADSYLDELDRKQAAAATDASAAAAESDD
jgi:hypothetical protein